MTYIRSDRMMEHRHIRGERMMEHIESITADRMMEHIDIRSNRIMVKGLIQEDCVSVVLDRQPI